MIIYCVKYQTGYDYDEILKYFFREEEAEEYAKLTNKQIPMGAYVSDIEVN